MKKGISVFAASMLIYLQMGIQLFAAANLGIGKEVCSKHGFSDNNSETHLSKSIADQISIYYTPDKGNTFGKKYMGVRIGEYFWMNSYLEAEEGCTRPISKEEIDSIHKRYIMFNYREPSSKTYWDYTGVTLEEFLKYYGATYNNGVRKYMSENSKMGEGESKIIKDWRVPSIRDCQQLAGMCGEATVNDGLKYLVWGYDDPKAPLFARFGAPGYWFYNNYSVTDPNTNKYGFNWVAAGWRAHNDGVIMYTLDKNNQQVTYTLRQGELIGYNQVAAIFTYEDAKFILNEDLRIQYQGDFSWSPIRMCRPLTDEELGYKLYINQEITEYKVEPGWQPNDSPWGYNDFNQRTMTVDDILVERIKQKQLNPNDVKIEVRSLSEPRPDKHTELPRGFIRGLYVQHILNNTKATKSVADILNIAVGKKFLWVTAGRIPVGINPSTIDQVSCTVYPNPVADRLYFNTDQNITSVCIYDKVGILIETLYDVSNSIDMSQYSAGFYLLKIQINENTLTQKVVKK